jgi:hypothetical protein
MKILQRWSDYSPTKEHMFWTVLVAVAATLVIGFGPGGWVTGGTADKMAADAGESAHNELAAQVCASAFMRAADARARLAKLESVQSWERYQHIASGGWATMPGEKEADNTVAEMCAVRLAEQGKI